MPRQTELIGRSRQIDATSGPTEPLQRLRVAAGILRDEAGRVLISDRRQAASMRDLWEFPGGKLGPGESSTDALRRELAEELGIEVRASERRWTLEHDYPHLHVEIEFFLVGSWFGTPQSREGQRLRWIRPADIDADSFLPADAPVLKALQTL